MSISSGDVAALSRLLDQALDLDPAAREAWLAALDPGDRHLQAVLREMLAANGGDGGPALIAALPALSEAGADDVGAATVGDLVGPYRLIREIGQGGMGAVWLAEKADGSLRRELALKLPRLAWGAGLAERMARERDIGALLVHPGIARLYDAGVDRLGRPYLALEYIDGVALDEWCRAQALSIPERLRLFLQVVRAVAYAHGRLVVHRDLKPSNVLVTRDGQAQLLDFGIAKLLDDASADDVLTREHGRALTPRYASPEQLRGEAVTVASDVYSLGVLLYELLTGLPPYDPARMSLAALEARILEGEPPAASSRAVDRAIQKSLRGELDAIVGKALKAQPPQRYATADALAEDIERHLKGERVLARPDSVGYRIGKVVRRHRSAAAAAGAVLVAIVGAAGVSIVQARRASDAAERSRVVKEFVVDVFKVNERGSAGRSELRQLPAELLLERGAKLIESKFPGQPKLQAELFGVVGGIFADMGANRLAAHYATQQVEALVAIDAGEEEQAKATILLTQALLAEGRIGDAEVRARRAAALAEPNARLRPVALVLLARVLRAQGNIAEAQRVLDRADRDLKTLAQPTAAGARAMALRASFLLNDVRFDEAMPLYVAAIDAALAAEGPSSPTAIDIRLTLAASLVIHDRGEEATAPREAALAALRASGTAGEIRAALEEAETTAHRFAGMFPRQASFAEAIETIGRNRQALADRGPLVPAVIKASIDSALGRVYVEWGDVAAAEPLVLRSTEVLAAQAESLSAKWDLAHRQAQVAMLTGQHDRAGALLREVIDLRARMGAGLHPWAAYDYAWAALNLRMQGKLDAAEQLLKSAPPYSELKGGGGSAGYSRVIPNALAAVMLARGSARAALESLAAEGTDEASGFPFDSVQFRGEALCAIGRPAEGLVRLDRAIKIDEADSYPYHPWLARTRAVAGLCALAAGQRARAVAYASQAREAFAAQPKVSDYFKAPLRELDRKL